MSGVEDPLLTICMPTYRRPDLLARALASLHDSDVDVEAEVEIIVSDNAPEAGESVATPWLARWGGPTRYFGNATDIGAVENFNQCINQARGQFVMLLHDDDYLLPGALSRILSVVRDPGLVRCFLFGVLVVDGDGHILRQQGGHTAEQLSPEAALRQVLTNSSLVRIPALVVNREAILDVGAFDVSVGNPTDFDLFVRLFGRFGFNEVAETVSAYSVHEAAQTSSMFRADMIDVLMTIFDRAVAMEILPERVVRQCQVEWFHQFVLGGAYRHLRVGETAEAARIMGLLDLPAIKQLGRSRRWRSIRLVFSILVRLPPLASRLLSRAIRRLGLERRIWTAL